MDAQERFGVLQEHAEQEKQEKRERFRRLNRYCKKNAVVMAGSSLMEQFPIYEFLQDFDLPLTIYNRGIGGFTTRELAQALPECILNLEPSWLFLNIGTNDMSLADYSLETLAAQYRQILLEVRRALPKVRLYLLAYYPGNPTVARDPMLQAIFARRTNARIAEANEMVRALAAEFDAVYLDLNAGITDPQGNLKAEYTVEGMHMYADGYQAVLNALLPTLRSIAKEQGGAG